MRPDSPALHAPSCDSFRAELDRLVELFNRNLSLHKSPSYSEARLRMDFLDPFFRALGWDVESKAGRRLAVARHAPITSSALSAMN